MMGKRVYRIVTGSLLAAWMAVIFLFSAQPAVESGRISGTIAYRVAAASDRIFGLELETEELEAYAERIDYPLRKCAHMTEYAIMGWLGYLFLAGYLKSAKKTYWLALGLAAVYAATDELHQLAVPGRSGQFSDVCVDTAGAAAGLLALWACVRIGRRWRSRREEKRKDVSRRTQSE